MFAHCGTGAGRRQLLASGRVVLGDAEAGFDLAFDALLIDTDLRRDTPAVRAPPEKKHLDELAANLGDEPEASGMSGCDR